MDGITLIYAVIKIIGSLEPSPVQLESFFGGDSDSSLGVEDLSLEKDIADAMLESPNIVLRNGEPFRNINQSSKNIMRSNAYKITVAF